MLFDFAQFVEELKSNPAKEEIVSRYSTEVESLDGLKDFKMLRPYTEHIGLLPVFPYATSKELEDYFDWQLLMQLVLGSLSSKTDIAWNESQGKPDLYIVVSGPDKEGKEVAVVKTVSELWSFQVLRLFEIYVEENMNLEILRNEDKDECLSIDNERKKRMSQALMLKLKSEKLRAIESLKS